MRKRKIWKKERENKMSEKNVKGLKKFQKRKYFKALIVGKMKSDAEKNQIVTLTINCLFCPAWSSSGLWSGRLPSSTFSLHCTTCWGTSEPLGPNWTTWHYSATRSLNQPWRNNSVTSQRRTACWYSQNQLHWLENSLAEVHPPTCRE